MKKNLLIAVAPEAEDTIARGLSQDFNLTFCDSLDQLRGILNDRFDLILCGPYFGEKRIFDLLRYIKVNVHSRNIPVLGVKAIDGDLSFTDIEAIKEAALAIGAIEFIDLSEWIKQDGSEAAFVKLRNFISHFLVDSDTRWADSSTMK